jgi:single-strand DNA-binding protein
MRGINKVILIGNATRDAELRYTTTGKPVANVRMATNRMIGEREETQFHSVVCWGTLAETTSKYVKKGDPFYVEGRLQYRTFQDEEGKERGVAEVVAADVQFLGRRRSVADAVDESTSETVASPGQDEVSPDEIPF